MTIMDTETEMHALLTEIDFLDSTISALSALKSRKGYDGYSDDAASLIDRLDAKRKRLKASLDELTDEIVAVAEAYADLNALELCC